MCDVLSGERGNLYDMVQLCTLDDQLIHESQGESVVKFEVVQDSNGDEFEVRRRRRIHEITLKYGDEWMGRIFHAHFVSNPTGHHSAIRNNLETSTLTAEIVRQIRQKTSGTAPAIQEVTLPAHNVIKHGGDSRVRLGKNDSVSHVLTLIKGVEAADANSTRNLREISQDAGAGSD